MTIHHLWGYTISGQDHLPFGRYVLNFSNARFEEYEDGMASYIMDRPEISYRRIRRLLSANSEPTFGWSKKVEKIYLTTPSIPLSKTISEKVEYVNIIKRWEALSSKEKKIIQSIFDMEESVISIKTDTILLTRPFSEERMCSEEEKTKQVNEIVKNYDCKKIAIKPHYRELTDYTKLFPDIPVINSSYPIELLLLVCGSNIKRIVTFGNCSAELFIKHYMPQIEYVCV